MPDAAPLQDAEDGNWVLCVTFRVMPVHADEFVALVSGVINLMRHEPNFVSTALCHDPATPGRFFLFETWKSRERFIAEDLTRAYRKPYEARLKEIALEERRFEEWRQVRADYSLSA